MLHHPRRVKTQCRYISETPCSLSVVGSQLNIDHRRLESVLNYWIYGCGKAHGHCEHFVTLLGEPFPNLGLVKALRAMRYALEPRLTDNAARVPMYFAGRLSNSAVKRPAASQPSRLVQGVPQCHQGPVPCKTPVRKGAWASDSSAYRPTS